MSADTSTAGYPVHRVTQYHQWENKHQARFTDYLAACGHTDTLSGWNSFGRAGSARRLELCRDCFPSRSCHEYFPAPEHTAHRVGAVAAHNGEKT